MAETELDKLIEGLRDEMVKAMVNLIEKVAISPLNGGKGELERANYIMGLLNEIGFDEIKRIDAKDNFGYIRPNIIAIIHGENRNKTKWIVTHMDTVPEGDRSLWKTDPFKGVVVGDKIYGRGTTDNGQSLIASIYAVKAIKMSKIKPKTNIGLIFVSDEETGSEYGLKHVLNNYTFGKNDEFLVPDYGNEDGSAIEVAEKGILWFRIKTYGIQAHASTPHLGLNAHRIGMLYSIYIDEILHRKFNKTNDLFDPPYSTFEPTKKECNVQNINTIPGTDVVYFDCRILPEYKIDDVIAEIEKAKKEFEEKHKVKIEVEIIQRADPAPPTDPSSEIVKTLSAIIERKRSIKPKVIGIGGGTVAAYLREKGYPAVAWSTIDPVEHSPNEYCKIENMVNDAKVFAEYLIS